MTYEEDDRIAEMYEERVNGRGIIFNIANAEVPDETNRVLLSRRNVEKVLGPVSSSPDPDVYWNWRWPNLSILRRHLRRKRDK